MNKKIERILSSKINKYLNGIKGAILISGPKWCGKTYLSKQFCRSFFYLDEQIRSYDNDYLKLLIENKCNENKPLLIDEWQLFPSIWDITRRLIDNYEKSGIVIFLTGSSTPSYIKKINHSGAGRIFELQLNTLTMDEINHFDNKVSLSKLLNQDLNHLLNVNEINNFQTVQETILYGGWPEIIANNIKSNHYVKNYIDALVSTNFRDINGLVVKKHILELFLKSVARLNGTIMSKQTIYKDLNQDLSINTLAKYFEALNSVSLFKHLYPWTQNVRSRSRIRTKPKVYLCDPSIGLNVLGINSIDVLASDPNTFGIYFENLVIKDLMVYADALDAKLYYFRDGNNFEIDAIMQFNNGQWAAIEIKLSEAMVDEAANNLIKFSQKIQIDKFISQKPQFLMIITATTKTPYIRNDGVIVTPHSLLGL